MDGLWKVILDALKRFIDWFFGIFAGAAETMIGAVMALIPADLQPSIAAYIPYVKYANTWVPLDFGFSLFLIWTSVFLLFHGIRIAKSYIPTMGD